MMVAKFLNMHLAIGIFFFYWLLKSNSVASQNNGNVTVGSSLVADGKGGRWLSASGDFAFGFRQLEDEDGFLLSIWYDKIPEKTIVWYANGDNLAPRGSKLNLTADRGLVLITPEGEEKLISDPVIGTVSQGSMKDTGNFVLESGSNFDGLWESFNQIKDTILPGQKLVKGSKLSSRRSQTNYSRGRFQLNLLQNGKLELSTINIPSNYKNPEPYYSIGGDDSGPSINQMVFDQSACIFLRRNDGQELVLSQGETRQSTKFYHRATLDYDGVFIHYRHPKNGNGGWSALWSIPENICLHLPMAKGSGVCGFNRICTLTNDKKPNCQCPKPFSLVDPDDEYRGCVTDFLQSCENEEQDSKEYYLYNYTNIDWPTSDYEQLEPYEEDDCGSSCLSDCLCAVAIFRDNTCYKKKLPLSNGRIDINLNSKAFIKMRKINNSSRPG